MAQLGWSPTGENATGRLIETGVPARDLTRSVQVAVLLTLGLASAVLRTCVKLNLSIPGHAAIFWLVPILIARLVVTTRGAATLCSTTAALGMCALRGLSIRWPFLLTGSTFWVVGPVLDAYVWLLNSRTGARYAQRTGLAGLLYAALAGVAANYAHLGSKVLLGVFRPHAAQLGLSPALFPMATYLVFGLIAGILAYAATRPFSGKWRRDRTHADGFSLIELLVVLVVIAVLAGLLLPALVAARQKSARVTCATNLKQIAAGLEMYCSDSTGYFPSWHGYGWLAEDVRYFDRFGVSRVPDVADEEKPGIHDMRAQATAKNEQKSGNPKWQPGDLARCPINLGFLMVAGYVQDGLIFRCPSAGMDGREAIWKKIGGNDAHALLYGYDVEQNKQQVHVKGSYNYRNAAVDLFGDVPSDMPFTRPIVTARPNSAPFATQRLLGARTVCCDTFDRPYAPGGQEDNPFPGRGAETHIEGYNVLYGDWHVKWYGDPEGQIIWYWPEYRSSDVPTDNPDACHDWIDRSNLGAHEVWHLFDVAGGIDGR